MPYPRAWLVLLLLIPLTLAAFWRSWLSVLADAPFAFHVHGITASLWVALLIAQSWLIHNRPPYLHRWLGRASFVLFPLFMVGALLVLQTMARHTLDPSRPFMQLHGAGLGAFDTLTIAAFAWLYWAALRHRRAPQLHARYMLATPLLLLAPVLSRLLPMYVPALAIEGVADFGLFAIALHVSNAVAAILALALYAFAPRYGRPFAVIAGVIVVQSAVFEWIGPMAWWQATYTQLVHVPSSVIVVAGLLAGATIVMQAMRPPVAGAGAARVRTF